MNDARSFHASRAFVCLSVLVLAACGADTEGEPLSGTLPVDTTLGAELPAGDAAGAARGSVSLPSGAEGAPAPAAEAAQDPTAEPETSEPAPDAPSAPTPAPPAAPVKMPFRGINLAGGEFGSAIPGVEGRDYRFPSTSEVDYYMAKGMNTFRIGFKWERLQRAAYGSFDAAYAARLDAVVTYASSKGAKVILNPHNFARYYGNTVGSTQVPSAVFADFWSRLASKWVADDNVMFNLVNEPHTMPTEQWVNAANAAIVAIRKTGATNAVIVPGNSWTGAHSWASSHYGTPNAIALLKIVDPADNVIFEAHQYMDADSSGSGEQCISTTIGSERLAPFVKWLRDNNKKGMIGEFAGARNQTCYTAVTDMLSTMMASSDVLVGWLWWAGGPGWGDYKFTLEPTGGKDQPQMAVIAPFLKM